MLRDRPSRESPALSLRGTTEALPLSLAGHCWLRDHWAFVPKDAALGSHLGRDGAGRTPPGWISSRPTVLFSRISSRCYLLQKEISYRSLSHGVAQRFSGHLSCAVAVTWAHHPRLSSLSSKNSVPLCPPPPRRPRARGLQARAVTSSWDSLGQQGGRQERQLGTGLRLTAGPRECAACLLEFSFEIVHISILCL